ncbi:hypothetical protein PIB30_047365 [Stylosanthes scabra]|uniref:Uncharacterized protein n=1 Tax=Stylosanthes scabra TaxID=79078 RepID=A0ABU6VI85_9FABA|nr:hypothetical protein [Stylosanthes scabra]
MRERGFSPPPSFTKPTPLLWTSSSPFLAAITFNVAATMRETKREEEAGSAAGKNIVNSCIFLLFRCESSLHVTNNCRHRFLHALPELHLFPSVTSRCVVSSPPLTAKKEGETGCKRTSRVET